jgi:hypothetical protein
MVSICMQCCLLEHVNVMSEAVLQAGLLVIRVGDVALQPSSS